MELNAENLTVRECFNHFRHTVVCPTYNLQLRSQLLNGLMMEGVHLNFFLAKNLMDGASLYHRNAMGSDGTFFFLTMVDVRRLFRWQVLIKASAHTHVDELESTTDAQDRHVAVLCQLEERQVVSIARVIHFAQFFVSRIAILSRIEILATSQDNTIKLSHNLTEHFYIVCYRDDVRHTTVHQYGVHIRGIHQILLLAISLLDTDMRFVGNRRGLCSIYLII